MAHKNIVNKRWTEIEARSLLSTFNIGNALADKIVQSALNSRELKELNDIMASAKDDTITSRMMDDLCALEALKMKRPDLFNPFPSPST